MIAQNVDRLVPMHSAFIMVENTMKLMCCSSQLRNCLLRWSGNLNEFVCGDLRWTIIETPESSILPQRLVGTNARKYATTNVLSDVREQPDCDRWPSIQTDVIPEAEFWRPAGEAMEEALSPRVINLVINAKQRKNDSEMFSRPYIFTVSSAVLASGRTERLDELKVRSDAEAAGKD